MSHTSATLLTAGIAVEAVDLSVRYLHFPSWIGPVVAGLLIIVSLQLITYQKKPS